jgi:hypothetical protein
MCLTLRLEGCRAKEEKECRLILALQLKKEHQHCHEDTRSVWSIQRQQTKNENTTRGRGEEEKPAEVAVSEATRADDIFTKLSNEILKAMFTSIKSNGRNGAPPQSSSKNGSIMSSQHSIPSKHWIPGKE